MIRRADTTLNISPYRLSSQLTGWMLKHQKPLMINDFAKDDRFSQTADKTFKIRSLLSVPLLSKGKMIGVLTLFNKKQTEGFSNHDQRLVSIISSQSAQIIENARLYEEEQQLIQVQKEMEMACKIQMNLLPQQPPQHSHYEIIGKSIPAQFVRGDYFDFIPIDANKLAICLGDVSGKGLPAAMLMANLQATIRGQVLIDPSPKTCLQRSNKLLYLSTDRQKFATFYYGVLDFNNHQFCYANAGHNRPLFLSKGKKPMTLETAGLALSIVEKTEFDEGTISFKPGDLLFIYSDGITEAMNKFGQEYGEEKISAFIYQHQKLNAADLVEKVVSAVDKFAEDYSQKDDMTLVVIKRVK
jgi:sigma-B regulation protein RsbU (phosphoserine phosphatase)